MLEVVQDEQEWSRLLQLIADELWNRTAGALLDFERVRHGGCHQVGLRDRRQTNKLNARREPIRDGVGQGNRQPRFTGTSRASQAQKPNIVPQQ